jgi:hypothetical protein
VVILNTSKSLKSLQLVFSFLNYDENAGNSKGDSQMKKIKILSHPTQIATIQLDDLDSDISRPEDKMAKMQIRKWRKLRHQMA